MKESVANTMTAISRGIVTIVLSMMMMMMMVVMVVVVVVVVKWEMFEKAQEDAVLVFGFSFFASFFSFVFFFLFHHVIDS